MFRTRDFLMLDVIDINNKRVGLIKDVLFNFSSGKVVGFLISSYSIFTKNLCVLTRDIISFDRIMVVKKAVREVHPCFQELKGMDVYDTRGDLLGIVEDIMYDNNYDIKGVIVTSGIIKKMFTGKRVMLINELIFGEKNVLFYGNGDKFSFIRVPHKIIGVDNNEKNL